MTNRHAYIVTDRTIIWNEQGFDVIKKNKLQHFEPGQKILCTETACHKKEIDVLQ
jgi:hypothetical protein